MLRVDDRYIDPDLSQEDYPTFAAIAFIEFNDANDQVGVERGRVVEGDQPYVWQYEFGLKDNGYAMKLVKGADLTHEQFERAVYKSDDDRYPDYIFYDDAYFSFEFDNILGYGTIPIGSELAKLEVYDNVECTGEPLEVFKLVL